MITPNRSVKTPSRVVKTPKIIDEMEKALEKFSLACVQRNPKRRRNDSGKNN